MWDTLSQRRYLLLLLLSAITNLSILLALNHAVASAHPAPQFTAAQLITRLTDTSVTVRVDAAYQLGELGIGNTAIFAALSSAARDPVTDVRIVALFALGKIGIATDEVLTTLTDGLQDREPSVRYSAAHALGTLGPSAHAKTPKLLATLMEEDDDDVRYAAMAALPHIGIPDSRTALPVLIHTLEDPNWYVRREAAAALVMLGSTAIPSLTTILVAPNSNWTVNNEIIALAEHMPETWTNTLFSLLSKSTTRPTARLLSTLALLQNSSEPIKGNVFKTLSTRNLGQNSARSIWEAAIATLGYLGDDYTPQLLLHLDNDAPQVRQAVISALDVIGPTALAAATTQLVSYLQSSSSEEDRQRALDTLGEMGPKASAAAAALLELLNNTTVGESRIKIITTLGAIAASPPETLTALIVIAENSAAPTEERVAAINAISRFASEADPVLDRLIGLFTEEHHDLRMAIIPALGAIGKTKPQVIQRLTEIVSSADYDEQLRQLAIQQLANAAHLATSSISSLRQLLPNTQPLALRSGAVHALGAIGPQAASVIPDLIPLFADPNPTLADGAARATGLMGALAFSPLVDLLDNDQPEAIRLHAVMALTTAGPNLLSGIIHALAVEPPDVRIKLIEVLAQIGPRSITAFRVAINDPDEVVRANAQHAFEQLFSTHQQSGPDTEPVVTSGFAVPEAIPVLLAALQTLDAEGQQQAAAALGIIGPEAVVAASRLGMMLLSDDPKLSCTAALSLILIGPQATAAAPYIAQALTTQAEDVNCQTDKGFRRFLYSRPYLSQLARLVALSSRTPEHLNRHTVLIETLALFGPSAKPAIPILLALLQNDQQRHYAAEALGQIGVAAAPILLQQFQAQSVVSSEMHPAIKEALRGHSNDIRRSLLYALLITRFLSPDMQHYLTDVMEDDSEDLAIRTMAAIIIQQRNHDVAPFWDEHMLSNPSTHTCPYWPTTVLFGPPRFDLYWDECIYTPPRQAPTVEQIYQALVQWLKGG